MICDLHNLSNDIQMTLDACSSKISEVANNFKSNNMFILGKGTDEYIVERSFDTKNYEVIGSIKASGHSTSLQAYALVDKRPAHGVNYYRLALSNHSSRSGWLPVIALRYKPAEETTTTLSTGR